MQTSTRARFAMVVGGLALAAAALVARLVMLQMLDTDRLRQQARRQHEQVIEVGGRRGSILDREGREFAVSVATQSLYAHPSRVKDPERVASKLAPLLSRPESELRGLLRSGANFVWLRRRLDSAAERALSDLVPQLGNGTAIAFQEEPRRFYPQGSLAVHVVGSTDPDQLGTEGIEKKFDDVLQGDSTRYLAVRDARGAMILQPLRPPAKRSHDVILTIDLVLQHVVERELDRAMRETGAKAASAILLDPKTGHVLALANRPTLDRLAYRKGPADSRSNRAIEYAFEPGSTFKVVSTSAALERGTVTPEQRFNCASITIAGKSYTDVHKFGVLSVREILEHSSNVGMVQVGRTVSREWLRETIVGFGFGRKTGIELPGERNGNITSLARMSAVSPASMSIGYEVGVTALQVAQAYGVIANDGVLVPARVVLGTRDDDGRVIAEEAPESRRVVSSRTAVTITNMMEGVVLRGTGKSARVSGYHMAGKTGTAKKVLPDGRGYTVSEYYASFGGFGPLREPRLVGYVMLDTPRGGIYYGGQVAAPVFERIIADAFAYLRVPPDDDPWEARTEELKAKAEKERAAKAARRSKPGPRDEDDDDVTPTLLVTSPGQVPDLRGKAVRDAVAGLVTRGYRTRVDGDGVVVRQSPPPGTPLAAGQACTLHLGDLQQLIDDEKRARAAAKAAAAATLLAESQPRSGPRRPARKRP
jgi:cell division protein FtsI/penicillin-binding protein 2